MGQQIKVYQELKLFPSAVITAGSSTTIASGRPLTSTTAGKKYIDLYINSANTSGDAYGMRLEMKQSAISTGRPRTLTLWCVLAHASGHTAGGGNALHANLYLGGTEAGVANDGIAGEAHAMASHLIIAALSRTVQGTYCAHKFVNEIETGNTMPANSTYFVRFHDAGTEKTPVFFEISGTTQGGGKMFDSTIDTTGAQIDHTLKIDVLGTDYYIPLMDNANGS